MAQSSKKEKEIVTHCVKCISVRICCCSCQEREWRLCRVCSRRQQTGVFSHASLVVQHQQQHTHHTHTTHTPHTPHTHHTHTTHTPHTYTHTTHTHHTLHVGGHSAQGRHPVDEPAKVLQERGYGQLDQLERGVCALQSQGALQRPSHLRMFRVRVGVSE